MPVVAEHSGFLPQILIFLGAAVVGVPLVRFAGLSAVIGYLVAGIAIGPGGLNLFSTPQTLSGIAELGIVMFLFLIGLELKPSKLIEMRRDILLLGAVQMAATILIVFAAIRLGGGGLALAFVAGVSLALSATAIGLQMLQERGELQSPGGQKLFAILLFQDISVVPLLAVLPFLAPGGPSVASSGAVLAGVGEAIAALAAIVLVGRYLLNILFGLLARFGAREVMTAAALLIVLGSALLMSAVGMSMALGAFIAGLLLAESNFRHELEADIEPFRGLLLGLFFMAIGMGLDLALLRDHLWLVLGATLGLIAVKLAVIGGLLRFSGLPAGQSLRFASLMTAAGEFAFVLLPLAAGLGLAGAADATLFTGVAALSMVLSPLIARLIELGERRWRAGHPEAEPEEDFDGAGGRVLVIGFGRFGQQVTQVLLSAGTDLTVIDKDVEMIQAAARFGFKIYYGDGARLDVLRAAGATEAGIICICIDDKQVALVIVEIIQAHFPLAKVHARAYDRRHAIDLMGQNVDLVVRETFEAAMNFGGATLRELGHEPEQALAIVDDVRRRDEQRLAQQKAAGMFGGVDLVTGAKVQPEPLAAPKRRSRGLSELTKNLIAPGRRAASPAAE